MEYAKRLPSGIPLGRQYIVPLIPFKKTYNLEGIKVDTNLIERKFNELPNDLKKEVLNFIDFLITKKKRKIVSSRFNFDWEGSLSDIKNKYSSVNLQHKSMEWR